MNPEKNRHEIRGHNDGDKGNLTRTMAAIAGIIAATSGCGGKVMVEQNFESHDAGNVVDAGTDANIPDSTPDAEVCDFLKISGSEIAIGDQTVPKGASNVQWACWKAENGCIKHTVDSLVLTRYGAGNASDLGNLLLSSSGTYIAGPAFFDSSNSIELVDNFDIEADATTHFCAFIEIMPYAQAASTHGIEINGASDLEITPAVAIEGDFPVTGNLLTVASGAVGTCTVEKAGQLLPIQSGFHDALIAQFRLYANGMDGLLQDFRLSLPSTCNAQDMENFILLTETMPNAIPATFTVSSPGELYVSLNNPITIEDGNLQTFWLDADVNCMPGTNLRSCFNDYNGVKMMGLTYGFDMSVNNLHDCDENYHEAEIY